MCKMSSNIRTGAMIMVGFAVESHVYNYLSYSFERAWDRLLLMTITHIIKHSDFSRNVCVCLDAE